jgi:hypothetical protein
MHRYFTFFASIPWIVSALFCLEPGAAFSQRTEFIQPILNENLPGSAEMDEYKSRLRKNPNISAFHFVRLNPLKSAQQDGLLRIRIPGTTREITAEVNHVEYHDETNYEWVGKTNDGRGTVILIAKSGRVSAHISMPDGVYEIFPAPNGLYSLREINSAEASNVGCATNSDERSGQRTSVQNSPLLQGPTSTDDNAKMYACQPLVNPRVLVLYTPKALAIAGSVATVIDQANLSVAQFNSTVYNSGITSNAVLTLAGVAALNFSENNNMMTADVKSLSLNNITAQNLRNQYQADMVVLFTNGTYGARGATATPFFNNTTAYSIVQILNAVTNKTFAHEVGHILGCRHDGEDGDPQYAQGYNIKNGLGIVIDRTMMSNHTADGSNRLLNFSNPNISVGGKSTGTVGNNNNAKRISDTHLAVGNFRPNPNPPLAAYVDGPTYVTTQGGKNYELNYSCGNAPYSFVWQYSYDRVNYTLSNTTTDIFTWFFYQNQKIYLKGTVTASGKSTTAFIAITAQMPSPYKQGKLEKDSLNINNPSFSVSPNPVTDEFQIDYQLEKDASVRLEMLDLSGKLVQLMPPRKIPQHKGAHSIIWESDGLASGTYLIRLTIDERTETQRIVIQR